MKLYRRIHLKLQVKTSKNYKNSNMHKLQKNYKNNDFKWKIMDKSYQHPKLNK